jgi:hypothetical protein
MVGSVTLDVHTLMYAAASLLMGFQGVMFFAFTRIFAVVEGFAPNSPMFNRFFNAMTFETGLITGVLLLGFASPRDGSVHDARLRRAASAGPAPS